MGMRSGFAPRVALVALIGIGLVGCAGKTSREDLWRSHFGIRPDEPLATTKDTDCARYDDYVKYAQELQEAYHSRATQNRAWIYVAGIVGLGAAAATGGLAAAAASATTIALVAISGGFAAGTFAVIDNSELAKIYTISANQIDTALIESDRQQRNDPTGPPPSELACGRALGTLKDGVSAARTLLEQARTNSAVAALIRARDEQKTLTKLIEGVEAGDPTRVTVPASVTTVSPTTLPGGSGASRDVELTVENIQLDRVALTDVRVVIGSADPIRVNSVVRSKEFIYTVRFKAPDTPPDPPQKAYPVSLLIGKSQQPVVGKAILNYP